MTEGEWRELRLYNSGAGPLDLCKVTVTRAGVKNILIYTHRVSQPDTVCTQGVSVTFYVRLQSIVVTRVARNFCDCESTSEKHFTIYDRVVSHVPIDVRCR